MSKAASFKQIDVKRALQGAQSAGLKPTGYSVAPDGTIHVRFDRNRDGPENSFDAMLGDGM